MKTLYDLKCAYKKAIKNNEDTFSIEGYDFVTGFAKYMIDYLDNIGVPNETPLSNLIKKTDAQ